MQLLQERIRREGKVLPGNIIKVDGFLNHRVDTKLLEALADEFAKYFDVSKATVVLTAEASGIALATICANRYGLPLDVRADYTKSDWLVWCASMTESRENFDALIDPLWLAYHESSSRVPLSDWYDTKTADHIHFRNRTVQGGLFMPMLLAAGTVRL